MAKIIRKKAKRQLNWFNFAKVLLFIAIFASIVDGLFLRNFNNSLTMQIEDMQRESSEIKVQNEQLTIAIQSLTSKDRIYDIASAAGLTQREDNVKNVIKGE